MEQGTHNPLVLGSNPGGPTTETQNQVAKMLPDFSFGAVSCELLRGLRVDRAEMRPCCSLVAFGAFRAAVHPSALARALIEAGAALCDTL